MTTALQKLDPTAREAISMLKEYDDEDVTVGRLNEGVDPAEFDFWPPLRSEFDETDDQYLAGEVAPFRSPSAGHFPILKAALRRFQASASPARAVRIDTPETYLGFASEQVLREIDRRLCELRERVEQHESDGHGGDAGAPPMRKWEVLGAMRAVEDLRNAPSAREAMEKLEQVPLDLPGFARGKVHCWQDGDCVICSMHFAAADGSHRVATAAARPSVDADEVAEAAVRAGADPVTVLGVLPDLAAVAAGKRLVRDVAGIALKARKREELLGADGPVVVVKRGDDSAPAAALMYLQQRADGGDPAAQREVALLERAAAGTEVGRTVAAPALTEARRRLAEGRQRRSLGSRIMGAYARAAGWL